jgi:Cellulose binding domain
VQALVDQDTTSRTKYDIQIKNTGSSAISNLSARIYLDISEVLAAGRSTSDLRCDERYESVAATCTFVQYNGSVYYANLLFTGSLAVNTTVTYKITLRLADWSSNWSSSNDFSRSGLTSGLTTTQKIPAFQASTLIAGTTP